MPESVEVAIIGAGQAGLSLSYELAHAGIEHLVLERARVGQSWRERWDSFCLVTPNWSMQLPGGHYDGDDPDGFMPRDEIVDHFVRYAQRCAAPIREGVEVFALQGNDSGGFRLQTTCGDVRASQVVVASGAFQKPHRPSRVGRFPAGLHVIDAADYANPHTLPLGKVLVIGSGQTGCQLAEELFANGRDVFVACGRVPWIPRRVGDADFVEWFIRTSFLEATFADLPSPLARLGGNVQSTGRDGGHDLHYRTLQAMGATLLGHLLGVEDGRAHFATDLSESVAFGDARYNDICALIRKTCAEQGLELPEMPTPPPFAADAIEHLDLSDFGAVIFTTGYRPDYKRWVEFPEAFDDMGFPIQVDGSSVLVSGLHFMGVHFQRKRKSSSLLGVAEDATVLAERIASMSIAAKRVSSDLDLPSPSSRRRSELGQARPTRSDGFGRSVHGEPWPAGHADGMTAADWTE